jgi:hypothetical protein
MEVIAERVEQPGAPLMRLHIHDAPNRALHRQTIRQYREIIRAAVEKVGFGTPYGGPIELKVVFVNPSSTDLGNLYLALEQALDGKALRCPGMTARCRSSVT